MSEPRITTVVIEPLPTDIFGPKPQVKVFYDHDRANPETLFSYFPDEISFRPSEFIGLTREQAMNLRKQKDIAYLQS
jgi:hypothetical protein